MDNVTPMPNDARLEIVDREGMSLLGLMLGEVIERSLARKERAALASRLKGAVAVRAGDMEVTIRFRDGVVSVARGADPKVDARVRGSLDALLQVSLGRGAVRSFLAGEIGFGGNPLFLLKMLPLMRVPEGRASEENQ